MSVDERILSELQRGVRIWRATAPQPSSIMRSGDLLLGRPLSDGPVEYARRWATHMLECPSTAGLVRLRALYRAVEDDPTDARVIALARGIERYKGPGADEAWYLVAHIAEDPDAWRRLTHAVAGRSHGTLYYQLRQLACIRQAAICRPLWEVDRESLTVLSYLSGAISKMAHAEQCVDLEEFEVAERARVDALELPPSEAFSECHVDDEKITDGGVADLNEFLQDVYEDRILDHALAKPVRRAVVPASAPRPAPTVVVVPTLPEPTSMSVHRRDIAKSFQPIAGTRVRLVTRGDVAAHRSALIPRWPHAADVVDILLGDLAPREAVRLRPTLLIGSSGSGKTTLARKIADRLGLRWTQYAGAAQADGSLAGTSSAWSSARPSVALDMIRASEQANPLIIVDEIDKIAESKHNGNVADALLAFLERSQAKKYRDLCLEVDVDLSHVNWILTANRIDLVPAPLRDRCRILRMPDPTWAHVPALLPGILADVARDRGLDPRWIAPLAADELAVLRKAWSGGSLRRLRRAVEVLVDTREKGMAQ